MGILEILLIGVGLSMDAFAVSISNSMIYPNLKFRQYAGMPVFFGAFQGLMPLIGFYAGSLFAEIIEKYSGIVILVILGFIGGKMILDGIKEMRSPEEKKEEEKGTLTVGVLFFQAIATSIDAFAVGVGFVAAHINIWSAVSIIAATTFVLTIIAILCGRAAGEKLGDKAQIVGGIILVIIGIKAMF